MPAAPGRAERPRNHGPRHVGPRPGTGLTEDQMAEAIALKRGGLSYRKIGEALGCTAATVEYNLTIRQRRYAKPQIRLVEADRGERHPIDAALAALGWRATVGQQRATLDGRPASLVQIVEAANAALAAAGQDPIAYPGLPRIRSGAGRGGASAMSAGRMGPATERWARKLLAQGRDPAAVAAKLLVPYQAVAALVAQQNDEQFPPDGCQLRGGDADGRAIKDPSEPSDHRGGRRGRTSTSPEVPRAATRGSPRANGVAEPRSVTAGRDRHPPSTVVQFPAPVLRHDGVPAAEVFAGTRLERAFGPGPGVGLGDLVAGQCRWPLWPNGTRPSFRCCGAATGEGARYCAAHARQSRGAATSAIDGLGKWASSA